MSDKERKESFEKIKDLLQTLGSVHIAVVMSKYDKKLEEDTKKYAKLLITALRKKQRSSIFELSELFYPSKKKNRRHPNYKKYPKIKKINFMSCRVLKRELKKYYE